MSKLVLDIAQGIEDDFYSGFRPANGFFTIEDIARKVVDERDSELDREFLVQLNNKNQYPMVNPMWVKHVIVPIEQDDTTKQYFAKICEPLYEFPMDERGMATQTVSPFGGGCSQFVRITTQQDWSLYLTASSDIVFYSVEGCRILLSNFYNCCDKVDCVIVPSQSGLPLNQQTVPDGKAANIREVVLSKMFRDYQARLGKISQHNDGNKNPQPNESGLIFENLTTK